MHFTLAKQIGCEIILSEHMNRCSYVVGERKREDKSMDKKDHTTVVDPQAVERISREMPDDEIIGDLSELFKVLGDPTRAKILFALEEDELCVGDIAVLMDMNQSAISHQLRLLKRNRLLRARRDGKQIYYTLHDEHVSQLYAAGMEHVRELFT